MKESKIITFRPLTDTNLDKINAELASMNWDKELISNTVEEDFNTY